MKTLVTLITILTVAILAPAALASKILVPMDLSQTDHLKAYGVAYWCLKYGTKVEWLLNYRGGSFLTDDLPQISEVCRLKGVSYETISGADEAGIKSTMEDSNMETVILETVKPDGDIKYRRDTEGRHYVPKRSLDDIILK